MNPYLEHLRKAGPPLPSSIRMQTDIQTREFCPRDREALIACEERIREVWKNRCEALRQREESLAHHLGCRVHVLYNEYRDIIARAHRPVGRLYHDSDSGYGTWAGLTRAEEPFWSAKIPTRKLHEVNDL